MKVFSALLIFIVIYFGIVSSQPPSYISPVILVPGYGGSQLEAKLERDTAIYSYCSKTSDWYSLWLNLELLIPGIIHCWIDNIKLFYNEVTRTTHNTNGVDIRVPGWGDPEVVEWINPTKLSAGAYFKDIANVLVKIGYERGKSIRGAPYDFRKAPNELKSWFVKIKQLVEDTYEMNQKAPITFITHSMGSLMTLVFLQQQTQQWKEKYILKMISLAGAWAGSVKTLKVYAMGDDLDSFALNGKILRKMQIKNPSTAYLLPSPLFWSPNEVIVETPSRKYTMTDLKQFFNDINYKTGWEMRLDSIKYTLNFSPPDVKLYCLYGVGKPTVERLVFRKDNLTEEEPILLKGDGDGTVNIRSLRACTSWEETQTQNITTLEFPKVDHLGILSNKNVLDYIASLL